MKISEVLTKARDTLMAKGWTQHVLHDEEGRVCAVEAIASGFESFWEEFSEGYKVVDFLGSTLPSDPRWYRGRSSYFWDRVVGGSLWDRVVWFNNDPDRTFNQVVGAFDEAILQAKEQEL